MIIEPGTPQTLVVHVKPQWFYEVQKAAGIGAQAYDIARIGRDFRLVEDDVKHASMNTLAGEVQP